MDDMSRNTLVRRFLLVGALVGALALGACGSDDPSPAADGAAPAADAHEGHGEDHGGGGTPSGGGADEAAGTVIQPGRPGEAATTGGPVEIPEPGFNHTDVAFVQMMIPHHGQAIEMAELAEEYAVDDGVRTVADRIRGAQGPEILVMASWLEERNLDVPTAEDDPMEFDHGEHGHDSMMGMLSDEQLAELAAARGTEFDRLFLEGMIAHHEGAIEMAQAATLGGEDVRIAELAADVDVTQRVEIARMREMLAG